jgi:methylisocitrate lyase
MTSPGADLRAQIQERIVVLPGIFNAISARVAAAEGASALYLSGAGVTNGLLAMPDIALITLTELTQQAAYAVQASGLPIIADADTGFGEIFNVRRTVHEYERAGLAGLHLEDQVSPKRCGHLDGKSLISASDMTKKIRAALDSRRDDSFMIIARTDARGVEGLDAAVERAKRYEAAGADAIFPEGLHNEAEFEEFRKAISVPLLANMTEFGKTDLISVSRFESLGYNMVIFPMTAFRMMLKALSRCYSTLLKEGSQADLMPEMWSRQMLYDLIRYADYEALDRSWSDQVDENKT